MGLMFFAGVVVLMVFSPISAEINCEKDVHQNCPSSALYNTISDSAGIFPEKALIERCSGIQEDIDCKADYLNACDNENFKLYSLLTNGLKNLFSGLCNETSEIRLGYRQHIDCFRRSGGQLSVCLYMSLEAARRPYSRNPHRSQTEEEQVAALCTFQDQFRTCSIDVAKKSCSEEASKYLETVYATAIQDLVTEIC